MSNKVLFLALFVCFMVSGLRAATVNVITEGNYKLQGEPVAYDKTGLTLKHALMGQHAVIKQDKLRSIVFLNTSPVPDTLSDKLFLSSPAGDVIACNVLGINEDKITYRDARKQVRSIPKNSVAAVRLNAGQEVGYWNEPLIFDSSWVQQFGRTNTKELRPESQQLLKNLQPQLRNNRYRYLIPQTRQHPGAPLLKNIGLTPHDFTFRTNISFARKANTGIIFCFGGKETLPFTANYGRQLNRLILKISPEQCSLYREHSAGFVLLSQIKPNMPAKPIPLAVSLRSYRENNGEQAYELQINNEPPVLVADPAGTPPLQGGSFGMLVESNVGATIDLLSLSSIQNIKPLSALGNKPATDVLITTEDDVIPGSVQHSDAGGNVTFTLAKPAGQPNETVRQIQIPRNFIHSIMFAAESGTRREGEKHPHFIVMKNGERLHGELLALTPKTLTFKHKVLGQLSIPLDHIVRVDFHVPGLAVRSTP